MRAMFQFWKPFKCHFKELLFFSRNSWGSFCLFLLFCDSMITFFWYLTKEEPGDPSFGTRQSLNAANPCPCPEINTQAPRPRHRVPHDLLLPPPQAISRWAWQSRPVVPPKNLIVWVINPTPAWCVSGQSADQIWGMKPIYCPQSESNVVANGILLWFYILCIIIFSSRFTFVGKYSSLKID